MGLKAEFKRAREWIARLSFDVDYDASTFETTIRFLGGLNAAFDLSGDKVFLDKAVELANRLMPAFQTATGIPYSTVNLRTGHATSPTWSGGASFLAEFGTLQLEFRFLTHKTGIQKYADVVNKINDIMVRADTSRWDGLYPTTFHPDRGTFTTSEVKFGARGDSFYEYLLKQYLQSGKSDMQLWETYKKTMEGMKKRLVHKSKPNGLTYIAELDSAGHVYAKMDHLVCFVPGMLALDDLPGHLDLAKEIMYTCWQFYERNPTGIAPEIAGFATDKNDFFNQAPHYLLRPETVESLFILYRVTGDSKYQEWGWKIFEAIEKHCKTDIAYSGISNVGVVGSRKDDRMESFFMAETLKYLYLLFAPTDLIPLNEFVFNTEAHPTRMFRL